MTKGFASGGYVNPESKPFSLHSDDPYFAGQWMCGKAPDGGYEYIIRKPSWLFETLTDPDTGDAVTLKLKAYVDDLTKESWVVEEKILLTSVVDILREKGYTVIEPEPVFGSDWTCIAHGDTCEKQGLDWDCT